MSQKKNNKRLLAVLTMALFSIVSFAQGVKLADGVEPLPADAETQGSEYTLVFHDEFNEPDGTLPNQRCGEIVRATQKSIRCRVLRWGLMRANCQRESMFLMVRSLLNRLYRNGGKAKKYRNDLLT